MNDKWTKTRLCEAVERLRAELDRKGKGWTAERAALDKKRREAEKIADQLENDLVDTRAKTKELERKYKKSLELGQSMKDESEHRKVVFGRLVSLMPDCPHYLIEDTPLRWEIEGGCFDRDTRKCKGQREDCWFKWGDEMR